MHYDSDGAGAGAAIHIDHRTYDNGRRLTQCDQNLTGAGGTAITSTTKTYRGNVGDPGDNLTETINITSTNAGNPLVTSFDYSYDANKNKLKETIGGVMQPYGFGTTTAAAYDAEDRVTGWNRDDALKTQAWTLSKVGDWNTFNDTILGNETRVHGATHELSSITGGANPGALTHDAKGNITTNPAHGSQTYVWDFDNQLKQAVSGGTHKYYYDALGRRVMKHVAGENRLIFVHDGPQIIAEYKYTNGVIGIPGGIDAGTSTTSQTTQTTQTQDRAVIIGTRRGTATIQRKYVYSTYIDERCLMIDRTAKGALPAATEELFYYHRNNLYSTAAMTDAAGLVQERYAYDAYGNILLFGPDTGGALGTPITVSALGQPYTYTGRRLDDETENYHYRSRYYQAPLGRFLGRDRILYGDGYNMYAYVSGGPLNRLDPSGRQRITMSKREVWLREISSTNGRFDVGECDAGCKKMTVLSKLPHEIHRTDVGHTGIAIGENYYDYGPGESPWGPTGGGKKKKKAWGTGWWDNPEHHEGIDDFDSVKLHHVLVRLRFGDLAPGHTILAFEVCVPEGWADAVEEAWKKIYASRAHFEIPGPHCTSLVNTTTRVSRTESGEWKAFEGQIVGQAVSPLSYAKEMAEVKHMCGSNAGKKIRAQIIRRAPSKYFDRSRWLAPRR